MTWRFIASLIFGVAFILVGGVSAWGAHDDGRHAKRFYRWMGAILVVWGVYMIASSTCAVLDVGPWYYE